MTSARGSRPPDAKPSQSVTEHVLMALESGPVNQQALDIKQATGGPPLKSEAGNTGITGVPLSSIHTAPAIHSPPVPCFLDLVPSPVNQVAGGPSLKSEMSINKLG